MKKILVSFFLLIALLATACTPNSQSQGEDSSLENADIMVKVALATEKYTQDEDISSLSEGALIVAAAKGETEGAQFIIRSDKDISEYNIVVSDLKCGENIISANAVSVQTEIYAKATYGDNSNSLPTGYYPDAVIPVNYIVTAKENQIQANKNQGFFVDFKIPEDAAAGIYTGQITVKLGQQEKTIPVELEVYDFTICNVPYTKTSYSIWQDWLLYGELDSSDEKYMDYYDMLLDYNVCGYTFPHKTVDEYISYVREYYNKVPCFGLPYTSVGNNTNIDWDEYTEYMTALAQASIEDGVNYFDKVFYYFDILYDEYDMVPWRKENVTKVADTCDALEEEIVHDLISQGLIGSAESELAQSILSLTHVIPVVGIDNLVDHPSITHCPGAGSIFSTVDMERYYDMMPDGGEYWWYSCGGAMDYPQPDRTVNGYMITTRDHFWSNYEYDIIGDLYWNVNGYCNWQTFDSTGSYLPLQDLYTTASHDNFTNGDGYLLYPGLPYGSEQPFASLRLIALRDGIDDNTYMGMLGDLYKQFSEKYGTNTQDAKSFISFLNKNVVSRQVSKLNSENLFACRDSLAKAIELASKHGVMIEDLTVEQNQLSYVIYTDATVELTVNEVASVYETAGEGLCYRGTVTLDGTKKLSLMFTDGDEVETIELLAPTAGNLITAFETEEMLKACTVYKDYGSDISLNTNSEYSVNGNSAKVILSGYDFGDEAYNEQFAPKMSFKLTEGKKLSECESIEFWVYNDNAENLQVDVYLAGNSATAGAINFDYDTLNLPAKSWTKVVIDNFNFVSRDSALLDDYNEFGLSVKTDVDVAYTLYIDEVFVR